MNFNERVYEITRSIPLGRVTTYGQIALLAGSPRASRIVGGALAHAPENVPCHRVVNRFGGLSDNFSPFGRESHRFLLETEGIEFDGDGNVMLDRYMWYG
ncbi:MAG: methylated-DNA--[protein]-cysteine S-methyltransferase [Oscillospiraceae bacterium]|nr:methylated-DNA--[protein]-cysteine S-methyltransferase [Oscillospiraceae bacterium]